MNILDFVKMVESDEVYKYKPGQSIFNRCSVCGKNITNEPFGVVYGEVYCCDCLVDKFGNEAKQALRTAYKEVKPGQF